MYRIFGIVLFLGVGSVIGENFQNEIGVKPVYETSPTDKPAVTPATNHTAYIDRAENVIRFPQVTQEDHKNKKNIKKPRRTVQKIIKKNKSHQKKFYVYHVTSRTTEKTMKLGTERMQESIRRDRSTTQSHSKKRQKKYNVKTPRNPMPFKKMQYRKELNKRSKREKVDDVHLAEDNFGNT